MSLEAAIAELNENIKSLIDIEKQKLSAVNSIGEKVSKKSTATEEDAPKSEKKKSKPVEQDDEEEEVTSKKSKSAKEEKSAKTSKKGGKEISDKDLRKQIADFMDAAEDDDEADDREDFLVKALKELGANRAPDVEQKDRATLLYWIARKASGKKVDFDVHLPPQDEDDED